MTTQNLPSSDTSFSVLNESLIGEVDLNEDQYTNSLPHDVLKIREKFLLDWFTVYYWRCKKENVIANLTTYLTQIKAPY